jgi:uncharacterized protein
MEHSVLIPLFPLRILPLPGELVPLHIFEPRYKQLIQEAELADLRFGIYFDHPLNDQKVGSMMRLESVLKRYPKGEVDIIVKCEDIFFLKQHYREYPHKLYPGGDIVFWEIATETYPDKPLQHLFQEFQTKRGIKQHAAPFTVYQIANELNLDFPDRYKFITQSPGQQHKFLKNKVIYQLQLLSHEEKSRDNFHLN